MQTLMFEIDEGIAGSELTSLYKDDFVKMDECLDNIYNGLKPLLTRYKVVIQIYPTYHYCEKGFGGKDPAQPLNRVSDSLKHVFSYFKSKEMNICLEIHSSGIRTNQNGELGELAAAPLHYGEEIRYKSLPMDMEAVAALKKEYGDTFESVRFHELVGSHEIGLHDRERGTEETSHAFVVQDRVIRTVVDTVAESGLELVWSDHMFNDVIERKELFAEFQTWVDYAEEKLKDRLTLNWANNGWPMHKYIVSEFLLKDYKSAKTGMSVQSWFWQELDSSTMVYQRNGEAEVKWYPYAEMECPVELMAIFTLKYLKQGVSLVQFEPPHYFFNYYRPGKRVAPYAGNVEEKPDYSVREHTKRLIDILLNPDKFKMSLNLTDYYDSDQERFVMNLETNPAKRFCQNTLIAVTEKGQKYFDVSSDRPNVMRKENAHRIKAEYFDGVRFASRARMGYSGIDDMLFLSNEECRFYNLRNGCFYRDRKNFKNVLAVAPVNLLSAYVECLSGDPDELAVLRRSGEGATIELYCTADNGDELMREIQLQKLDREATRSLLRKYYGNTKLENIFTLLPVRYSNAVSADGTRPADAGLISLHKIEQGIVVRGCVAGNLIDIGIEPGAEVVASTTVDINSDGKDELCLALKRDDGTEIRFYSLDTFLPVKEFGFVMRGEQVKTLFSLRICSNTKAFKPRFLNLNNALI